MSGKTPEEEAQSLGWMPKSDWKGPEDAWKPAEKFLEDGDRMAGFVRKRLQKDIEEQQQEFDARIANIERTSRSALDAVQKQAETERQELLAELQAKKASAIEDNDLAALEKVREQIQEVKEPAIPEEDVKAAKDFHARHEFWQGKDMKIQNFADGAAGALHRRGLKGAALLAELDTQIRENFPEKFGKRQARGAVEGDSPRGERDDGKTYDDLPPEAKAACQDAMKRIKGYKKETYVKEYFGA